MRVSARMRIFLVAVGAAAALVLPAAPSQAVPLHRHCLGTPAGNVLIARGVTANAPHDTAFHNFHFNVHEGTPVDIRAIGPTATCPGQLNG